MPNLVIPCPMTGGVNLFNHPRDIRADELAYAKNLVPSLPGRLRMRPSSGVISRFIVDAKFPVWVGYVPFVSNVDIAVIYREVASGLNTGVNLFKQMASSNSITSANFGVPTQYIPAVLNYRNKIYMFGGHGSNKVGLIIQNNATTGNAEFAEFVFDGTGNESVRPAVVGLYLDRFVYANLGPGRESDLFFADPKLPRTAGSDILADDGPWVQVHGGDGDRIVALVATTQTGASAAETSLLVLKEYSAYLFSGEPPLADGTGDDTLTENRLPVNCGCSSPNTVARTPFGLMWTGPDDVWIMPEGQLPYRAGTKIRPMLEASPKQLRYRWHAVYDEGFYKLSLFSQGQGPGPDDPLGEQWWLDLREGPPPAGPDAWRLAQWWGPMVHTTEISDAVATPVYGFSHSTIDTRINGTRKAVFLSYGTSDVTGNGSDETKIGILSTTESNDGHDSKFQETRVLLTFVTSITFAFGDQVRGLSSGATGTVLFATSTQAYLGSVLGTFQNNEFVQPSAPGTSGDTTLMVGGVSSYQFDQTGKQTVTDIDTQLHTKEYAILGEGNSIVADETQEKGLAGAELTGLAGRAQKIQWKVFLDSGKSVSSTQELIVTPSSGIIFNLAELDTAQFTDERQPVTLDPAPSRYVGRTVQLRIYNAPGYIIDSTNNIFDFKVHNGSADFQLTCTLTNGYYASLTTLAAELKAKMDAAILAAGLTSTVDIALGSTQLIDAFWSFDLSNGAYTLKIGPAHLSAPANASSSRFLAHIFGLSTWDSNITGNSFIATTPVYLIACGPLECEGMRISLYTIPRRTI